jgi:aspartate kinase
MAPIFAAAARHGIAPDFALSAVDAATLYFAAGTDAASMDAVIKEGLAEIRTDEVRITEGITLIAIVGSGGADMSAAAKVAGALTEARIESHGACSGVSETNIIVGVADKDYETALRAIYAKLTD